MIKVVLKKPDVNHYTIANHVGYHKLAYPICKNHETVIDAPALICGYRSKVEQEEVIYKWLRRSEFTEKKAETDQKRDVILRGMEGIVHVNLKNFDPSIRDNALHVNNLLLNYGDITHAGYDAETAAIDSVSVRLRSADYLPAVTALGLLPWLNELDSLNSLFKSYVEDVAQELIDKPDITPGAARRETDEALRQITGRVTSLVNLNGPDDFAAFAEEFNVLTNHYNTLVHEHYGRLHARIDISPAEIALIEVQPFTGKPVSVIPEVSLKVTNKDGSVTVFELVFTVDFTVAYRNNIGPGTATLIIQGIGKYAGEVTTTFNIS
jgi:hypothetical protein